MATRFIGVVGVAAVESAASLLDLGLTAWEITRHDDDAPDHRALIISANAVLLVTHIYYLARAVAERQRSAQRIAWWLAVVLTDAVVIALVAGGLSASREVSVVPWGRILQGLRYARMGASAINAAAGLYGVRQVFFSAMDGVRKRLEALAPEETPDAPSCPADNLRPLGAQSKVGELFQCAVDEGSPYIVKRQAISRRRFVRMHRHLPIPDVNVDEFDNEVLAMDVLQALELSERHRLVPRLLWSHTRREGRSTPVGTIAMEQAGLGDLTAYCDKAVVDEATAGDFAAWLYDEARRLYDQSSSVLFTHGDPKAANFFVLAGDGGAPQLVFGDVGKARYLVSPHLLVHARPKHGVYVPSTTRAAEEYTYTAAPTTTISRLARTSGGPELFWAHERQRPRDRTSYQQAAAVERSVLAVSTMLSAGDTAFAAMAQPRVLRVLLGAHLGSSAQVERALERIIGQRRRVEGRKSVNAAVRVLAGLSIVA